MKRSIISFPLWAVLTFAAHAFSQEIDITALGGDLSSDLPGRAALQVTAPNIPDGVRRTKQLEGFSMFHRVVGTSEGLGPRFANDSCAGCHIENGKGRVRFSRNPLVRSSMVIKVALQAKGPDGGPIDVPGIGGILQDHDTSGSKNFAIWLGWTKVRGTYDDGMPYTLRTPDLRFRVPGFNQSRLSYTLLMTPGVIGPGLLEAIPDTTILALSDPKDLNRDGISGRVNWVTDRRSGGFAIGRLGYKAGQPTVEQFSCAALKNDMGISNPLFTDEAGNTEVSEEQIELLTAYQVYGGVPFARNQDDPFVQRGKFVFRSIGCESCHTMTLATGDTKDERAFQTIHPFTDLLLHDMGPELASTRGDGQATGREWRTTPLWGLGFLASVSDVPQRYLHDGRARTIEEAILWHGGEGTQSRARFKALSFQEREALIRFLRSL